MGGALPDRPQQFLQLHVYVISIVCIAGPDTILAVYPDDERPRKAAGPGYDMEEGV